MYVFAKQSGELLNRGGESGDLWTSDGVRSSADKFAAAYNVRRRLGMDGLTLVSGAGNIIRGDLLRQQALGGRHADVLGRIATIQNTIMLGEALRIREVPVLMLVAPGMEFKDPTLGRLVQYEDDLALEAHADGKVLLIGGGTGEDGVTTDNAVMDYAQKLKTLVDPTNEIIVLKGTKHDGVFDADPATNPDARRIAEISARRMLAEYARFSVVDRASLEMIEASGIPLRVYRDGDHDLAGVLSGLSPAGTLIVPDPSGQHELRYAA